VSKADLKLPRGMSLRAAMVERIKALPGTAKRELFQEADEWAATVDNARDVIGVLNGRYDLCVLQCDPPAPWFAAAFDTTTRELILAREVPNGQAIDCLTCAQYCAEALGEWMTALECY